MLCVAEEYVAFATSKHPQDHRFGLGVATKDQVYSGPITLELLQSASGEFGAYKPLPSAEKKRYFEVQNNMVLAAFDTLTQAGRIPAKTVRQIEAQLRQLHTHEAQSGK